MSVKVLLKYDDGSEKSHVDVCFGFFPHLNLSKVKSITYYPLLSGTAPINMENSTYYIDWLWSKLNFFIEKAPANVTQLIRNGVTISTDYPTRFIVGLFELYRDTFYYPTIINNFRHFNTIYGDNKAKAYYVASMLRPHTDSALYIDNVRRNEYKFLNKDVLTKKLEGHHPARMDSDYIGINSFFRYGEVIKPSTLDMELFFTIACPVSTEAMAKRKNKYLYNKEELRRIYEVLG